MGGKKKSCAADKIFVQAADRKRARLASVLRDHYTILKLGKESEDGMLGRDSKRRLRGLIPPPTL